MKALLNNLRLDNLRLDNLRRIRTLDPARDYMEIYQTMLRFEFPWDMRLSFNLAFNRTFSIGPVATVLARTGELLDRTQKRIDDTGILMYEMILNGFEHPRGLAAIRRLNQIHRPHSITNDDAIYTIGALTVLPIRFLEAYGWRKPCCHEIAASYATFRELGRLMHVTGIPDSYESLESWFDAYDRAHLVPDENAAAIERATRMLMLSRFPKPLRWLGDSLVSSAYDERLRAAVHAHTPAWPVRFGWHVALRTRARLLRWFGRPRAVPLFAGGLRTTSYPDGYEIEALGPHPGAAQRPGT
jgi:ER-bound oxygenase mpaB/B'/Rubber oxygenase, catalytic domain